MTRPIVFSALFLAFTALNVFSAGALEPNRESLISRAVFSDGKLWLLSDSGALSTIAPGSDSRTKMDLSQPALDLWLRDGDATIAACDTSACKNWELRRWTKGQWRTDGEIASQGDTFVASASIDGSTVLLTSRRLIEIVGDRQSSVLLAQPLREAPVASLLFTHDDVFVGFDAGEWGGGLQRVDRETGAVAYIEGDEVAGSDRTRLNAGLDPVNGLAIEPWKPDCIAAAIGLIHFGPRGHILEICGNTVRRLYFKPCCEQPTDASEESWGHFAPLCGQRPDVPKASANEEPASTVAFFGLVSRDNALWAAGMDGLYRIAQDGSARSEPLPHFTAVDGISVSFEHPDFVLVLTDINKRRSISGSVPMLVPR